jgi:hypothetical protein
LSRNFSLLDTFLSFTIEHIDDEAENDDAPDDI